MLLGDEGALANTALGQLGYLVDAHLMWSDVGPDTVPDCLAVMLRHNLVVGSRAALYAYLALLERRQRPRNDEMVLSSQERVVLRGLTSGLTQREIADAEHMSEPTVRRTIATLRSKFGVGTTYALCAQAGRYGLVNEAS
jgi:DNA-binding NarL/FixJ family response regulator